MKKRTWFLIDADGNLIRSETTARPSGPVLGNMEASRGLRWMTVETFVALFDS